MPNWGDLAICRHANTFSSHIEYNRNVTVMTIKLLICGNIKKNIQTEKLRKNSPMTWSKG